MIIFFQGGSTGNEIKDLVLKSLSDAGVDKLNVMNINTDGCSTMLGKAKGAVTLLRLEIATLPEWGGCTAHDLSNILKAAVKALCPYLTDIFAALFGCLSKHSMKKKRAFEFVSEEVGLEIKKVPKFLDVRWRVILQLCLWMESQDRALYQYFTELKEDAEAGRKAPSDTEMIVLENYLKYYLEVRFSNLFIIETSKPIMNLISFFEGSGIKIHHKQDQVVLVMHDMLSKFMKNAGVEEGNNNPKGRDLLHVRFRDRSKQLSREKIFLGKGVEDLLKDMEKTRSDDVVKPLIEMARSFYEAATEKMVKYFTPVISSESLGAMTALDPTSWASVDLDSLKKKWRILGQSFGNVLEISDLPDLMTEVAGLKIAGVEGVTKDTEVDQFFKNLSEEKNIADGSMRYPLLVRLGQALSTIYHASSSSERDFSLMNSILADKSNRCTSLELLQAKMYVKAECMYLKRNCGECRKLKKQNKESDHCHCDQWNPPEALMKTMRDGGPWQRYEEDMKRKAKEAEDKAVILELNKAEDQAKLKQDLKKEVGKLASRIRRKEKEAKEAKKKADSNKATKSGETLFQVPKAREPSAAQKRREEIQRKLRDI